MDNKVDIRVLYFLLICFLLSAIACATSTQIATYHQGTDKSERVQATNSQVEQHVVKNDLRTVFAIEYAVPGLAEIYAKTGVTYTKIQPVYGVWGNIEPENGKYNWSPLDEIIHEYQAAGIEGIQVLITAESPWASTKPPSVGDRGDSFPKEEFLDEYADFVSKFVERYDGDGVKDAPKLIYPVHHYGIEREFTGFWPSGDADDYVRLLEIAYKAIKQADPDAQVISVALLLVDVFDGNPSPDEIEARLSQPELLGYSRKAMEKVLGACDYYDIVDFHSLGDYTEIPPTAGWIRETWSKLDCEGKPIWIGDAFSMSALTGYNDPFGILASKPFYPATEENIDEVLDLLEAVADPNSSDHDKAQAWLQGEMASGIIKKFTVSAAAGLAGINIGNLEDWFFGEVAAVNVRLVRSMGTSVFMGMIDRKISGQHAGTPFSPTEPITKIRIPQGPRPAYYALELFLGLVKDYQSVNHFGSGVDDVQCYEFYLTDKLVKVLWFDDGHLYLAGEAAPSVDVNVDVEGSSVQVYHTPEESQPVEPIFLLPEDGILTLDIRTAPVIILVNQ